MSDARDPKAAEITPRDIAAVGGMEKSFYEWWFENAGALEAGYCGNVLDLWSRLRAAWANSVSSSLEAPIAE